MAGEEAEELFSAQLELEALEFGDELTKGAKWSPDGTCLLSASEDCVVRLFEAPESVLQGTSSEAEWKATLHCRHAETVYDYAWYPMMHSSVPVSCIFATSSRDHPIHLWDAFDGSHRASYRGYDHLDELDSAISLGFSPTGEKLYAGYERCVRVFRTSNPGRGCQTFATAKTRRDRSGQKGLVGAVAVSSGSFAVGSYDKSVALYDERSGSRETDVLRDKGMGGVTSLVFDADDGLGVTLWSGGRNEREGAVRGWDLRMGRVTRRCPRRAATNQRIGFSIKGRALVTGSDDCRALVYDLRDDTLKGSIDCGDVVNGAAFHPHLPLIATATGQRRFGREKDDSDSDEETPKARPAVNSIRVWRYDETRLPSRSTETPEAMLLDEPAETPPDGTPDMLIQPAVESPWTAVATESSSTMLIQPESPWTAVATESSSTPDMLIQPESPWTAVATESTSPAMLIQPGWTAVATESSTSSDMLIQPESPWTAVATESTFVATVSS